mgnify:CR=1 FL=1
MIVIHTYYPKQKGKRENEGKQSVRTQEVVQLKLRENITTNKHQ